MDQQAQESLNASYKFMHFDQLKIFKQKFLRAANTLVTRMYKSVFAIYCLFPCFNQFEHLSIFDKVY